ncbi:hypothetical protein F5H01DRAFT_18441 [Linnemannia elongata]|nr:hypothetical protein F5H01DRAFT_18441 [Linnemannia elongata]
MSPKKVLAGNHHVQPVDKRVPVEVWEQVFKCLYPSQLSRLSKVSKTFNSIVASLSVWSHMFKVAHTPSKSRRFCEHVPLERLRTLRKMSKSKSHMIYMCAISLYICERCFSLTSFLSGDGVKPMKTLAPMPSMNTKKIHYVAEEIDLKWTINLCSSCCQSQVNDLPVHLDSKTRERILQYRSRP